MRASVPGRVHPLVAPRLESLDVLRGLAVAAMIVVNNPGDWTAVFPPLLHAYWTGLTAADLVFPAFLFAMGAAVPLAVARRRAAGASGRDLYERVAARVLLLIGLGLVLNAVAAWPVLWPLRVPGVLQRIALAYLVASLVVLNLRPSRWLIVAAALAIGHWALLVLVPFDGHPAGTLAPDRNLASFLDAVVFGRHALAMPNDPEGLLGTLSASATALAGAAVGELIRRQQVDAVRVRMRALALAGAAAIGVGLLWSLALPLSKPLWTGSFALVAAGVMTVVFAAIYFVVDVRGRRGWSRPLVWLGVSPLTIYVGSEVARRLLDAAIVPQGTFRTTPKAWLFWGVLEPAFRPLPPEWASLVYALGVLGAWVAIAAGLSREAGRARRR